MGFDQQHITISILMALLCMPPLSIDGSSSSFIKILFNFCAIILTLRCTHSNKKTSGLNSISFFKSETVINYRVMQMYLEWPRACSWIVDKNCIFHRRCFNYALILPKKTPNPSRLDHPRHNENLHGSAKTARASTKVSS